MEKLEPRPLTAAERHVRRVGAARLACEIGFVGRREYRHFNCQTGGAPYAWGSTIDQDVLTAYAEAFERDTPTATPLHSKLFWLTSAANIYWLVIRTKKLSSIRQELPSAIAATGEDAIRWLEARMTGSERQSPAASEQNEVFCSLRRLLETPSRGKGREQRLGTKKK